MIIMHLYLEHNSYLFIAKLVSATTSSHPLIRIEVSSELNQLNQLNS